MTATAKPQLNPALKLALDLGPLVLFFFANSRYGIFTATATFMVAVLAALAASYALTRHLPIMPVVTAIIVLVFGGLTLILHNETFIKIKPTISMRCSAPCCWAVSCSANRCSGWCSIRCSTSPRRAGAS